MEPCWPAGFCGFGGTTRNQNRSDHADKRRSCRQGALCQNLHHWRHPGGRSHDAVCEIEFWYADVSAVVLEIFMIAIRAAKVALVAAIALFASLVAFGNLTDYNTNFAFVQH